MNLLKGIGILIAGVLLIMGLSLSFGWFNVEYIKTVGKAKQNAQREVYEETNSFVKGKRMEIIKLYKEWNECQDEQCKTAIETIVSLSLADFDEDRHITDMKLLNWIKKVKY